MSFKVLLFVTRKKGMTFSAFQDHYENNHIPLIKNIGLGNPDSADCRPLSQRRMYTHLDSDNDTFGLMLDGKGFQYDAITEIVFSSKEAAMKWSQIAYADGRLKEDEDKFLDHDKLTFIIVEEKEGLF